MDGLTSEQRAAAWIATWNPSLIGKAIITPDFVFQSVNQQFCEVLGVTAGELIGRKFTDVTPEPYKSLDISNANLVKTGIISSYILPKCYEFADGKRVEFLLLVCGVYGQNREFLFYVSSILPNQGIELSSTAESPSPKQTGFFSKLTESWPVITALIAAVALLIAETIKSLKSY